MGFNIAGNKYRSARLVDFVPLVAADAKEIFDTGDLVPSEIIDRLPAGENPIRVWREYRGMTQQELADVAGISKPYLSQIETGERDGHAVLSKIAEALNLSVDEIIPHGK